MFNINAVLLLTADSPSDGQVYVLVDDNRDVPSVTVNPKSDFVKEAKELYTRVTNYSPVWGGLTYRTYGHHVGNDDVQLYFVAKLSLLDTFIGYQWVAAKDLTDKRLPIQGLR
jgi:hypothetical protein